MVAQQSNDELKLFIATIPKSGTHLIAKVLRLITGRMGQWAKETWVISQSEVDKYCSVNDFESEEKYYYLAHAPYIANNGEIVRKNKLKVILLLRDPRDILISYAHYVKKDPEKLLYYERYKQKLKKWSLSETVSNFIKHYPCGGEPIKEDLSLVEFYKLYLEWQNYDDLYVTTFEKLVGRSGGGSKSIQMNEIKQIGQFLNISLSPEKIDKIAEELFGGTETFREGSAGSWKKELTNEQKGALKALPGLNDLLIALGYEKDDRW